MENEYNLNVIKEITVTDSFLSMADEVRECHEEETFDECVTEKYMEVLKAECDCLPLNLRIHDEVKEENTIVRKAFQMCGQGPRAGRGFNKLHQEV